MDCQACPRQAIHVYCLGSSHLASWASMRSRRPHRHLSRRSTFRSSASSGPIQGLPTTEMEKRVTTFSEFVLATVNDIRSIESQTLNGVATIKVYFHPQVRIDAAMAQINSAVNGIRFRMPPGINPPWILRFGADTVPIIQLALSSQTLSEAQLYDYGIFRVRQQLSTVAGHTAACALWRQVAADHGGSRSRKRSSAKG